MSLPTFPARPGGGGWGKVMDLLMLSQTFPFPSVWERMTYLWLLQPLFLHVEHQETVAAPIISISGEETEGCGQTSSSPFPSPVLGPRGLKVPHGPGSLDHTSLVCHLLATCHLHLLIIKRRVLYPWKSTYAGCMLLWSTEYKS